MSAQGPDDLWATVTPGWAKDAAKLPYDVMVYDAADVDAARAADAAHRERFQQENEELKRQIDGPEASDFVSLTQQLREAWQQFEYVDKKLATVTKERDILRHGHQTLIDERTSRIEAEARAHERVRAVEAELTSTKHLCNTEYERGVTVGQALAHKEIARLTALLAQQDVLKVALVWAMVPLEALHSAARWELADEVKASIGYAVEIGRAALLPPPPRAEGGRQEEHDDKSLGARGQGNTL